VSDYLIYEDLLKPAWASPAWLFGPVWTVLYILIGISFGYIFYLTFRKRLPRITALPFILNIIFNVSWTYLFFSLKNFTLSSIDILLILATLAWSIIIIKKKIPWVAYINIPYLLWVSFATILQFSIVFLNT
jgi:benzodiazapine receptor